MGRKKTALTEQEIQKIEEANRKIAIEAARNKASRLGKPSYFFNVGDKVRYGGWESTVVTAVFDDGAFYEVESISNKGEKGEHTSRNIVTWLSLRRLEYGDTSFTSNEDIRLNYNNSSVESLLSKHTLFGVDFNPDYQRELVWEDKDRELLLDSLFMGADIGRFVFRVKNDDEVSLDGPYYEIVDGKQRMMALLDFYADRYPYKGAFYSDLSAKDRRTFKNASVSIAEARNLSKKDTLRLFIMLNRGGRPISEEVVRRAKKMLEDIQSVNVAGIVSDSIVDGPGLRTVIFVQGCTHHCEGCQNPETWEFGCGKNMSVETLYDMVKDAPLCKGVTFSGGEPFCQAGALIPLAKMLKKDGYELASYSGFTFEQLMKGTAEQKGLLSCLDILVDGPFIQSEKSLDLRFRGSKNQRILDVQKSLVEGKAVLCSDERWNG